MQKYVQLPVMLFIRIVNYMMDHSQEARQDREEYEWIRQQLCRKIDAMHRHNLYSQSKTAENPKDREAARQKYLDEVGMLDSFRYGKNNNPFKLI